MRIRLASISGDDIERMLGYTQDVLSAQSSSPALDILDKLDREAKYWTDYEYTGWSIPSVIHPGMVKPVMRWIGYRHV